MEGKITVGCRGSKLSRAQFTELSNLLPHLSFEAKIVTTTGDGDRTTSLRDLDKCDFFTHEIDQLQLAGGCRLSLHSAKDLPEPLPAGLVMAALTEGVDPADSLVLREGETLKAGMVIATSSARREEMVRCLNDEVRFVDIRGNVDERLAQMDSGQVDGVVIAEAAMIRLGMTARNRLRLPGATAPLQGQLAVLARADDTEMHLAMVPIDSRPLHRTLCLGLEAKPGTFHYPIIRTVPRRVEPPDVYTHVIFTSKMAVRYFHGDLATKQIIAVGQATAKEVGLPCHVATDERAEGVVALLEKLDLDDAHLLWPHAAQARPLISDHLKGRDVPLTEVILYDTYPQQPHTPPDLALFDELTFTSPSTVDAFLEIFGTLPPHLKLTAQGPVTAEALRCQKPVQPVKLNNPSLPSIVPPGVGEVVEIQEEAPNAHG